MLNNAHLIRLLDSGQYIPLNFWPTQNALSLPPQPRLNHKNHIQDKPKLVSVVFEDIILKKHVVVAVHLFLYATTEKINYLRRLINLSAT